MARITVEGLVKRFSGVDRPAVANLSFGVDQGELLAILGPSGCGKTTVLRSIAGLETPDQGEIQIGDAVAFSSDRRVNLPPERRQLGMVFQSYAVWPHMTVQENVGYPLTVKRMARAEVARRVDEMLKMVALDGLGHRYPGQLSGGQQQRVALARALVGQPKALLFDEPLSNLDAKLREHMRFELLELQQRLHFTALYVTHDQEEAMTMANRIMVMRQGVVEQFGTPKEVYEHPASAFVADFLGAIDFIPGVLLENGGPCATVDSPLGILQVRQNGTHAVSTRGQAVSVGIRPHWVELAAPAGQAGCRARIKQMVNLGSRMTYVLACNGVELRAELNREIEGGIGDEVAVILPPERCRLFDRRPDAGMQ